MMDEGWATSLLGMGVGRFPETYFWKTEKGDRPGTFAFVRREGQPLPAARRGRPALPAAEGARAAAHQLPAVARRALCRAQHEDKRVPLRADAALFSALQGAVLITGQPVPTGIPLLQGRPSPRGEAATAGSRWRPGSTAARSGRAAGCSGRCTWVSTFLRVKRRSTSTTSSSWSPDGATCSGRRLRAGVRLLVLCGRLGPRVAHPQPVVAVFFEQGWLGVVAFLSLAMYGLGVAARFMAAAAARRPRSWAPSSPCSPSGSWEAHSTFPESRSYFSCWCLRGGTL